MSEKPARETESPAVKRPRPYHLRQREVTMEETRARVLAAARTVLLDDNALAGFSIDAVARAAGITRMTVYHRFGSKRGLLEAVFDDIGVRGGLPERLPGVFTHPDALGALRAYIEIFCDFWHSDRTLTRRVRGFTVLDPEFAAAIAARDARRQQAIERLVRRIREQGNVPMVPIEDEAGVVQTVLALTSFAFYDVLAGERSPAVVAARVFQLVCTALQPHAEPTPHHPATPPREPRPAPR